MIQAFGDWLFSLDIDDQSMLTILLVMGLIWLGLTGVFYAALVSVVRIIKRR